jgi:BED zinc finger
MTARHRDHPHLPRGVRVAQGTGQCNGAGIMEVMSNARSRRFPVTITQLPVTRCQICHRTIAYRPGNLSQVLTEHYRRAHPEALGVTSR